MKTIKLSILFTMIIVSQLFAQINPMVKEENGNYLKYWTNSKEIYHNLSNSQTKELKSRIVKEVKIIDGPRDTDFNKCFSTNRLRVLAETKGITMVISYFDQTGTVKAAGIYINKRYFTLTDSEIECLLSKIMTKKLQLEFSNDIFNFYYKVNGTYKPKLKLINPHPDELPDLDEGQY